MLGMLGFVFFIVLYFLPGLIATTKKRKNYNAIVILNLFLGWTIIGWVGALIWAVSEEGK
jgi:hypothetical protein